MAAGWRDGVPSSLSSFLQKNDELKLSTPIGSARVGDAGDGAVATDFIVADDTAGHVFSFLGDAGGGERGLIVEGEALAFRGDEDPGASGAGGFAAHVETVST